jgi:aminoglycoside phosphotransferase (APT) family kinase protein
MSEIDTPEHLLDFIQQKTGADHIEALEYRSLAGGAVQENHGLHVRMTGGSLPGEHRFVVRSDAPVALSVSLSRAHEFEILRAACEAGVSAPQPRWLNADKSAVGPAFYIMDWAEGTANARALVKDDALTATQRQQLMHDLGSNLARLHAIQYTPGRLPFLAAPGPDPAKTQTEACRQLLNRFEEPHPAIELGLQYLADHRPAQQDLVLCHSDFRTGNYLVAEGRLTAILDWEFASWSDPYEDLGWMCARCWRFGRPDREAGGVGSKEDLFAGYESVSGHKIDPHRLAYWELMAIVRWAVLALEQSYRHRSGQQESLELALTGRMVPEIQQDLILQLRELTDIAKDTPTPINPGAATSTPATGPQPLDPYRDQPDAGALLKVARALLLAELLPALPQNQRYNALMIANALGIAIREQTTGDTMAAAQHAAIQAFYQAQGARQPDADIRRLVQDIRDGRYTAAGTPGLLNLLDTLVDLKLSLSNPRRISSAQSPKAAS